MNHASIYELEKMNWTDSDFASYVVQISQKALRTPIDQLTLEEIRLLISQNLGTSYVLPIAISALENDILQEVTFYEGDLLNAVLRLPFSFWESHPAEYNTMSQLIQKYDSMIQHSEYIDKRQLKRMFP